MTKARKEQGEPDRPVSAKRPGLDPACLAALVEKPILSTESGLLTVPLGPSEARNTDTLDKLRQAVGA